MIVCQSCGEHNARNAEFCGSCGDFLQWTGAPAQTGAVQPDAALQQQQQQPHHRPQQTLKREPQPGDLICGMCGSGNPSTRRFCGVCGHSLVDAVRQEQPWWKRWLPAKGPKIREHGSRPRRARRVRQGVGKAIRWTLAVVLLLFGGLYAFSPPFRATVNTRVVSAKDAVAGIFAEDWVPVRQSSITAAQERPDHPAAFAMDNDKGTFWAAPTDPKTAALTIQFDHVTDLRRMIVHSGDPKKYLGSQRPQRLTLVFDTGKTHDVTLTDQPGQQEHAIANGDGVRQVQVLVAGVYPSAESTDTVISEIELFAKQVN